MHLQLLSFPIESCDEWRPAMKDPEPLSWVEFVLSDVQNSRGQFEEERTYGHDPRCVRPPVRSASRNGQPASQPDATELEGAHESAGPALSTVGHVLAFARAQIA